MRNCPRILCACLMLASACTTAVPNGRKTTDWLDATLTPADATTRWCLLPIAIPVGASGLLLDTLVVNPVRAIDDASDDTVELLWDRGDETSLRSAFLTPLAALATPPVFLGDWLWRCLFPCEPKGEQP